jgi:hypothetical protein
MAQIGFVPVELIDLKRNRLRYAVLINPQETNPIKGKMQQLGYLRPFDAYRKIENLGAGACFKNGC